ncbi:hypothetical protein BDP27DRAFT_1359653 [Rhodocollybia butyracea]|uniref:Uncharacterized protein n=1 Tax=Rhodocollybia butyracea TaxID=206335 RepID=A0A9P5Q4V9_9AGAR|nr:hypothetical protein BDP27DRAFT_1359653 [Rhodocollybia butyracea]
MSNIAKLITFTPLHKPAAHSSPSSSRDIPLAPAPRNIPDNSAYDLFDILSAIENDGPQADIWARFSRSEGFHDKDGVYYPPMDPEEIKQFAEKYFSPLDDPSLSESPFPPLDVTSSFFADLINGAEMDEDYFGLNSLPDEVVVRPEDAEEIQEIQRMLSAEASPLDGDWPTLSLFSSPLDLDSLSTVFGPVEEASTDVAMDTSP